MKNQINQMFQEERALRNAAARIDRAITELREERDTLLESARELERERFILEKHSILMERAYSTPSVSRRSSPPSFSSLSKVELLEILQEFMTEEQREKVRDE